MARGPKKTIDEKIDAKREILGALQVRIKSEQKELEELYREKREQDLIGINDLLNDSGISPDEARRALEDYLSKRNEDITD